MKIHGLDKAIFSIEITDHKSWTCFLMESNYQETLKLCSPPYSPMYVANDRIGVNRAMRMAHSLKDIQHQLQEGCLYWSIWKRLQTHKLIECWVMYAKRKVSHLSGNVYRQQQLTATPLTLRSLDPENRLTASGPLTNISFVSINVFPNQLTSGMVWKDHRDCLWKAWVFWFSKWTDLMRDVCQSKHDTIRKLRCRTWKTCSWSNLPCSAEQSDLSSSSAKDFWDLQSFL